jgi:hypothetical protein
VNDPACRSLRNLQASSDANFMGSVILTLLQNAPFGKPARAGIARGEIKSDEPADLGIDPAENRVKPRIAFDR